MEELLLVWTKWLPRIIMVCYLNYLTGEQCPYSYKTVTTWVKSKSKHFLILSLTLRRFSEDVGWEEDWAVAKVTGELAWKWKLLLHCCGRAAPRLLCHASVTWERARRCLWAQLSRNGESGLLFKVSLIHFCSNTFVTIPTSAIYSGRTGPNAGLTHVASMLREGVCFIGVLARTELRKASPFLCCPWGIYWPSPGNSPWRNRGERQWADRQDRKGTGRATGWEAHFSRCKWSVLFILF